MSIISDVLNDEYKRLLRLKEQYLKLLDNYPKGAPSKRKRSGNLYLYLILRQKNKVITKYVGRYDSAKSQEIIEKISERKKIKEKLKRVKKDLKELRAFRAR